MSNPIDDALMAKEAFLGGLGKGLAKAFGGEAIGHGMGTAAMGLGIAGIGAAAMKIKDSISKKRDFKEMMSLNQDLQEEQSQDPRFFNAAYNSLRRVNPEFGRDPVVAGSYMRKMMANPDAAGLTVAQSVKPMSQQRGGMNIDLSMGPLKFSG
jgi:hypothetical protein